MSSPSTRLAVLCPFTPSTRRPVCVRPHLTRGASRRTHRPMAQRHKPGSPTIAVGYVRASTERQELGPEAQRAELARWAQRNSITLAAVHEDALSGGTEIEDRPGLLAALEAIRAHRAGVLVISRRDRLARDVVIAATIERAVQRAGARVVSADGVGGGDSPAEAFQRSILDAVAQFERAHPRADTRRPAREAGARGAGGNRSVGLSRGDGRQARAARGGAARDRARSRVARGRASAASHHAHARKRRCVRPHRPRAHPHPGRAHRAAVVHRRVSSIDGERARRRWAHRGCSMHRLSTRLHRARVATPLARVVLTPPLLRPTRRRPTPSSRAAPETRTALDRPARGRP